MTSLLLDTQAMLWFVWDDSHLTTTARQQIENRENRKLVSVASCWEIAVKVGIGKLDLGESSRTFLPREIAHNNFELLPIRLDQCHRSGNNAVASSRPIRSIADCPSNRRPAHHRRSRRRLRSIRRGENLVGLGWHVMVA